MNQKEAKNGCIKIAVSLVRKSVSAGFLGAFALLAFYGCSEPPPSDKIFMSGSIVVTPVRIAPLIGGRIIELNIEEGANINEGDLIARIDCSELELQLKAGEAALKGAEAKLRLIKKGARQEDIANMREAVKQAEIGVEKAERDYERAKTLFEGSSIPQKQYDDAKTGRDIAETQLASVKKQYEKILAGARAEEIEMVFYAVEQAEASIAALKEKLTNCLVYSPATGTVLHKLVERGEAASPGMSVGVIADLARVKAQGYAPEAELGFIRLDGKARVFIDSEPETPIEGEITYISPEAEFTPKNIQTKNERVKTMYKIEVSVDNPLGKLKAGMPVDIVIDKPLQ